MATVSANQTLTFRLTFLQLGRVEDLKIHTIYNIQYTIYKKQKNQQQLLVSIGKNVRENVVLLMTTSLTNNGFFLAENVTTGHCSQFKCSLMAQLPSSLSLSISPIYIYSLYTL